MAEVTPLPQDCGQVCGGRCCLPSEGSSGMLLFPGEEEGMEEAGFSLTPASEGVLLTCGGTCQREKRPLACRFFPLFPHLDEQGRIRAVYDPRGYRLCPLLQASERVELDKDFVRAVRRAGRVLAGDEACRAFLRKISVEIDELDRFLRLGEGRSPICRRCIHRQFENAEN